MRWIGVVVFLAGVGVLLVVRALIYGPPLMLGGMLYAVSPTKGQRWTLRTAPRSEQASSGEPQTISGTRSVVSRLRAMKRGPAIGLAMIAIIIVAVVGSALTSGGSGTTDDPMYQQGFREASNSSVFAEQAGGAGSVCRAMVEVSDTANPDWATSAGKEAFYAGCVAGYSNK
jgi:hypothetical protein